MTKKLRFGFHSRWQAPLFMMWWEFWQNGEVVYATEIFSFGYLISKFPYIVGVKRWLNG